MKRYYIILLFLAFLAPLVATSCSEDDNTVEEFPDWRNRNEAYSLGKFQEAVFDRFDNLDTIRCYTLEDTIYSDYSDFIVVEKIRTGASAADDPDNELCPMFTDSVKVNYRGRLIPSTSYADGYVFDESYISNEPDNTSLPVTFCVSGLVDGFATALQYMHIGDYWRVYIPYWLGYGSTGSTSIPAYSTLIFDIELKAYYRAGTEVPDTRASVGEWITE